MDYHIQSLTWFITAGVLLAIVALDVVVIASRKGPVTIGHALRWLGFYVSLALLFAAAVYFMLGAAASGQFLASYVTEYSLSADNLFVFMMIVARFAVPPVALDRVLYLGIAVSLVLRGSFVAAGAAAVNAFSWIFYIFGAFLIFTAVRLLFDDKDDDKETPLDPLAKENVGLRILRQILPTTQDYDGSRFVTRVGRPRRFTPLALVAAAIGLANLVFALDSIPAVFGLTHSGYIVFTATAFAMMGLRQLYFVIHGLLARIIYLGAGLAIILGFIGVKLVFEALRGSHVLSIGAMPIPLIGTGFSLAVIVGVLAITVVASLAVNRRRARTAAGEPASAGSTR